MLKLNIHTWRKVKNLCKKLTSKLVALHWWNKLQVLKKYFFKKGNLSSWFVQIRSSKRFFEINWYRDIYVLVILWFGKIVHLHKIVNKTRTTKNKKIPHTVLEKIISQIISSNFCKTEFNSGELELFGVSTGYQFFETNLLVKIL